MPDSPRSTRGASGGVRRCGSGAVVRLGCNTHTLSRSAEAARSRRACCASLGTWWPTCATRHATPTPAKPYSGGWAFRIRALNTRQDRSLKRTTTGGPAEQGFKHRARDAGEMADLRLPPTSGALSRSLAPPDRREGIRPAGPVRRLRVFRKLVCARTPASRAALISGGVSRCKPRTQIAPRERGRLPMTCGEISRDAMRESQARSPSPSRGG
jgi:hypothetical protein